MCTGAEIALALGSTALSGVGSMMQQNEAAKNAARIQNARNAELDALRTRNKKLSDEATGIFDERMSRQAPDAQQNTQEQVAQQRVSELVGAAESAPQVDMGLSGSAPDIVRSEFAKRIADSVGKAKKDAESLGKLGAFSQMQFDNALDNQRTANRISVPVGFAQSNTQMLPYLQNEAELNATKPSSGIGQILQGAGTAGGFLAGSGKLGTMPQKLPPNVYGPPAPGTGVLGTIGSYFR